MEKVMIIQNKIGNFSKETILNLNENYRKYKLTEMTVNSGFTAKLDKPKKKVLEPEVTEYKLR